MKRILPVFALLAAANAAVIAPKSQNIFQQVLGKEVSDDDRRTMCGLFIDISLDEPLSARKITRTLKEIFGSETVMDPEARNPTPKLLQCCHYLYASDLFPGKLQRYARPKLPNNVGCVDYVDTFVPYMALQYSKSPEYHDAGLGDALTNLLNVFSSGNGDEEFHGLELLLIRYLPGKKLVVVSPADLGKWRSVISKQLSIMSFHRLWLEKPGTH